MRYFFDTNVLVYSRDPSDPRKRDVARVLIEDAITADAFVVSAQVLAEFYATTQRRNLLGPAEALELVRFWGQHDMVVTTHEVLMAGVELHQRHSLSVWDALVLQAAIDARCDVLLTEDFQQGRLFGALTVQNPFAQGPAAHEPRGRRLGKRPTSARALKAFTDAQQWQDHSLVDRFKRQGRT